MAEFVDPWEEKKSSFGLGDSPVEFADPWEEPEPSGLLRRGVVDPLVGAVKGVIVGLPQTALGLLDIPTMGYAGKAADVALKATLGIGVKEAGEKFDELLSPEARLAKQKVEEAEGFVPVLKTALQYPSSIVQAAAENLAVMKAGAMIGAKVLEKVGLGIWAEGLTKAQRTGRAIAAGATGEAVITAGQNIEQVRQEAIGGTLSPGQVGINMVSAALTGIIGAAGGKLAQRLGFVDVDTLLAGGRGITPFDKATSIKGVLAKIIGGAISEGAFEELPQSMQEQIAQNISLGKPAGEGVLESGAMGMLVGALLGAFGAGVAEMTPTQKRLRDDPLDQEIHKQIGELPEEAEAIKLAPPVEEPPIIGEPPVEEPPPAPSEGPPVAPEEPPPAPPVIIEEPLEGQVPPVVSEPPTPEVLPQAPPVTPEAPPITPEKPPSAPRFNPAGYASEGEALASIKAKKLNLADFNIEKVGERWMVTPKISGVEKPVIKTGETKRTRQRIYHFTKQENIQKILQEGFDTKLPPVHGTGAFQKREAYTGEDKTGKDVLYFTTDKDRWNKATVYVGEGKGTKDYDFYNYETQEWTKEKKALSEIDLSPIEADIKEGAKILTIDSYDSYLAFQNKNIGSAYIKDRLNEVVNKAKELGYDILNIKHDPKKWEAPDGRKTRDGEKDWYKDATGGSGKNDFFILNKDIIELQKAAPVTVTEVKPGPAERLAEPIPPERMKTLDKLTELARSLSRKDQFATMSVKGYNLSPSEQQELVKRGITFDVDRMGEPQIRLSKETRINELRAKIAAKRKAPAPPSPEQVAKKKALMSIPANQAVDFIVKNGYLNIENVRALSKQDAIRLNRRFFNRAPFGKMGSIARKDGKLGLDEVATEFPQYFGTEQKNPDEHLLDVLLERDISKTSLEGKTDAELGAAEYEYYINKHGITGEDALSGEDQERVEGISLDEIAGEAGLTEEERRLALADAGEFFGAVAKLAETATEGFALKPEAAPAEKAPQKEAYIGKTETAEIGGPLAPAATFELTPTETEMGELKPKDRGPKTEEMFPPQKELPGEEPAKGVGWTPQRQSLLDEARNLQKNESRKGYTPEEAISAYERATGEEFPYKMLVPHLNKLGVTISFNPNKIDRKNLAAAVYDPTRNQIIFNDVTLPNSRDPVAKYREIISHEAIHAIILNLKTFNPQAYVEMKGKLNNFLKEIEPHLEKADITTRMMFEAVSEKNRAEEIINLAFTNPGFARWLDTLPSVAGAKESKTLWGKLKDIILKAIDRVANFGKTKLDELNGIMDGFFGDVITKGGVGGVTGVGEMPNIPKPIFVRTRSVGEFDERYLYDLPNLKQAIDTADTDSLLEAYRSGNIKRVIQQYDGTDYNSYYPDEDLRKAFLKQPEIIQKRLFDIARKNIKKGMGKKWDISPIDKKVIDESGDALYFAMSLAELADNPKAFLTSTAGIDVTPPTKRIGPIIKSEFTQKMLPFVRDLADRFMDKPQENIPQEDLAEFKKWYVSQKDLKWYERVFELPWTLARKHPIWRKAFQIFGIERPEIRGKLIHKFAVVAEPYLALEKNMREAGKSKAEIKDAKERLARVIITGDALLGQELKAMRRQLRTMKAGPQRDTLIARIKQIETENRYSDEDLLKGIKDDRGNTVKLNKDEIELYKSVRNSLDLMFDTYLNHIKAQSFRTYRKQKWYAILAQAADMDLTQDQTLSILKTGLNQAALLRAVKIQPDIQRIFERVEKQIASTPDAEKLAAGELYGTIADKLTKEIGDLRTAIGTLTGITEDAELTDMTRGVLNAYMFTRPYLKKIKTLRNTYKKQVAFFPRVREQGPYKLKLMKRIYNKEGLVIKEQQVFMEMFGDEAGGRKIYEKIYKFYSKKGVLPDDMYIPKPDPTNATPEFAFQGVSDINMQSLLDDAIEGMKIRDVYYDEKGNKVNIQERLRDMGYQALAKQFQSRGFGRHMIHRQWNVVKGYEENNLQSVLTNYMSGMSGMMTKQIAAADFLELMKELGPGEKGHFKGLSMYGRGQLRNTSRADRIGGALRGWAFTWVLGGVIRPAVLQFTQNYVTGIPKHAKWLRENNLGGFGKADKDYNKAMKDLVTKNLTPLEKQMQDELFTSGHTVDQYVREMFDALGNRFEQEQAKYLRWLAYPFSQMEQFNRKSAALTRFRPAYQLALKEGLSEEDAYRKAYNSAIDFIGDTHYFMGKPNLPLYAQGEGMGIALRTGLTFKSFMHNFVLQIKSDLSEGDWKTVMHQMAYIALFGGLMGLPFFKDLFEWVEKEFGYSFTKSIRQTLRSAGGKTLETFGMNGLPAMLGTNMSGSLAIGIPFLGEETMATIGGVYEGQLKKLKFGAEAALRGDKYRAVLGITPEFLRSPIIAMQESEAGREMLGAPGYTTTVRGQPVWGKEGKPLSMGPYEALAKAGGFLPTEFGREKEMVQTVKRLELWATEKKQDAGERFRIARLQKNPKALKNLMEDVREINQGIRARGLQTLVPLASVQRILQSSRQIKNLKQRREQAFKRAEL